MTNISVPYSSPPIPESSNYLSSPMPESSNYLSFPMPESSNYLSSPIPESSNYLSSPMPESSNYLSSPMPESSIEFSRLIPEHSYEFASPIPMLASWTMAHDQYIENISLCFTLHRGTEQQVWLTKVDMENQAWNVCPLKSRNLLLKGLSSEN